MKEGKTDMKKFLKTAGKVLLVLVIVLAVLLGAIFAYNRIMLATKRLYGFMCG